MKQCIIDQLFSSSKDCLPICKERNVKKHVTWERKSSRHDLQHGLNHDQRVCVAVARASSTRSAAQWQVCDGLASKKVFNTVATVWCICLQIPLACRFLFVVGTDLMFNKRNCCWKAKPLNSPLLSGKTCIGLGYQESQVCSKWVATWLLVFSMICALLTRLVVVSMQVRAKNSTGPCGVDAGRGPIRSTSTSSQGAPAIFQSGSRPWLGPEGLACWHASHAYCSICIWRFGWWYHSCSVAYTWQESRFPSMAWNQCRVGQMIELVTAKFH